MANAFDKNAYNELGRYLTERHSDQLSTQLAVFQSALVNFGGEHGDEIANNSEFKGKFTQMCQLVGVDPLELVLGLNLKALKNQKPAKDPSGLNFHIALAVRVVEVCQQTRDLNGGLISLKELISILTNNIHIQIGVVENDIELALLILNVLGKGYEILNINGKKWLKFSSATGGNLSNDQRNVYEVCGFMGGYVTRRILRDNFGWDALRCKTVVDEMIMNGLLWVDEQGDGEWMYWEPSWISS